MVHEDIALLISKQIVGTITAEERQQLDAWRSESPYNEQAFQRLSDSKRLDIELERARLTDYKRPLAEMKHRLVVDHGDSHGDRYLGKTLPQVPVPMTIRWLAAAAVAVLIIGGALMLWNRHEAQPTEPVVAQAEISAGHTQAVLTRANGETITLTNTGGLDEQTHPKTASAASADTETAMNDLTTPRGGEFKVVLEDGTEVWLNADTHLRYPEQFAQGERRVELSGEAYFKVAKDRERPFYVVSGGQEIRVYGTEFNVNAYQDQPDVYTTLVEGSISLRPLGADKSELTLSPGHQTTYNTQLSTFNVKAVDTDVVTSWRTGAFVFEDQTLAQIMHTLSRWYDFDYEFTDQKLSQTEFMGSIPRYGSFREVAQIFEKMGGIRLRLKDGKVLISER